MESSPDLQPGPALPAGARPDDALLDALPWGVLEVDAQRIIRRVNQQAARWCGTPAAALLGQPLATAALPPALHAALLGLLEPGETGPLEAQLPQSGQWISCSAVRRASGWVLCGQDITERRHCETSWRASEEEQAFRLLLSDALRPLSDPLAIQATAARVLGQHLPADRAYYVGVDEMTREFIVARDWHRPGAPSHARHYSPDEWAMPGLLSGRPWVCSDVDTDPVLTDEQRADYRGNGIRAAVVVPLLKQGRLVAALVANQGTPRAWTPPEVALVAETLARTWAAVEHARAEQALAASEAKYRVLFDSIDEGFIVSELLYDSQGLPVDALLLETNPSYDRLTQTTATAGRRAREIFPAAESSWFAAYAQVVETGASIRFENFFAPLDRWIEMYVSRVGGPGSRRFATVFNDVTERKRREAHLSFLADISQDLVQLTGLDATVHALCAKVGAYFGAEVCAFSPVDEAAGTVTVQYVWHRPGAFSPAGVYRLGDYHSAEVQQAMRAGRPEVVRDTAAGPPEAAAHLAALGVGAFVNLPFVREGAWLFTLSIAARTPRDWRPDELDLMGELTARIWTRLERARAEEALRASELRLRAVMENLPGGAVFVVGADLRYQVAEGEALHQLGLQAADFVGRPVRELAPPELWPHYEQHYRQALAGQPFEYEHEQHGRAFATRGGPLRGADGTAVAVLAVSYDITARKQAEVARGLSEARLSLALQAGRMGSFEWTSEGNRISLSAMSEEVLGLRPDTRVATSEAFFALLHPDDRARHQAVFEQAGRTGEDFHSRYRIVRPLDGAVRWMEERGHGTHDPATSGVCLRGVHWDVTEPVLAQQQLAGFNTRLEQRVARRTRDLQASRDLLQSVFDSSLISMSLLEAVRDETGAVLDFRLQLVSRELTRETGRTDLVGKLCAHEYPDIRGAGIFDLAVQALETGEPTGMEYHYQHEGFDKWITCQFVKLENGVVATNLDITERKSTEQARLRNLRLLEQAEAVAGLGSWDYELATGTLRWSAGMYQLFSWPLGCPVAPASYLEVVVADDRTQAEQLVHRLATGAGDFEETLRLRVNGAVKTVRIKSVVFYDGQGQAERVLGVDLDISELQRLEHDNLRLRLRQQRALFEAVQAAQEEERKRMAESLHNGIGQVLYATKLRLDGLHALLLGSAPAVRAARDEADQLLSEAMRQTRALSHELVPTVLADFGLAAALQDIGRSMSSPQLRLHCQVVLDDAVAPLGPALQMALYRMAQELAQNIIKHAQGATEAGLELETMPGWVLLRADDNGCGFAPARAAAPGLGLRSIRDRVALLGGQLETGSVVTGGAYVRIRIPLPVAPAP